MAAGECWVFDSFRWHDVQNRAGEQRIHLVIDTVGGGRLPELLEAAEAGSADPQLFGPGQRSGEGLQFERLNSPDVMSPWEMRCHLAFIADQAKPDPLLATVLRRIEQFIDSWQADWARFGTDEEGRTTYLQLLQLVRIDLSGLGGSHLQLGNRMPLYQVLDQLILQMALAALRRPQAGTVSGGNGRLASRG